MGKTLCCHTPSNVVRQLPAVPAAPPTVQISKRSSQSYTGLTAILHTTLDRLYSTDHFALRTPGMHADSEMQHMWRPYILWFIGKVQELEITDSILQTFNFIH